VHNLGEDVDMIGARCRILTRAVTLAIVLGVSSAPSFTWVAHAQGAGGVRDLELHDMSLHTPGPDWVRTDVQPTSDKPAYLEISRQIALHDERLRIADNWVSGALAPSDVATQWFASERTKVPADGKFGEFKGGLRAIDGVDYPTLAVQYTPASGSPITDEFELLYFPADFVQRHRF
jgi:hypothetical protein